MESRPDETLVVGVTGASGCIGRMLVRQMSRMDALQARVLVHREPVGFTSGTTVVRGGLLARKPLESLIGRSDVILHLAARNPGLKPRRREHRWDYFVTNGLGTATVARLAQEHRTPLVYTSSVAVYELAAEGTGPFREDEPLPGRSVTGSWLSRALQDVGGLVEAWDNGDLLDPRRAFAAFLDEDPPPDSESPYALSKILGEQLVTSLTQGLALRLSDVYGPGHERRGILQDYLARMVRGEPVDLDLERRARVSFVYLGDVLRALLGALGAARRPRWRILNVAQPVSVSREELREVLLPFRGSSTITVEDASSSHLSGSERPFATERVQELLEMRWTSLERGVRETLRYLRKTPSEREDYRFPCVTGMIRRTGERPNASSSD